MVDTIVLDDNIEYIILDTIEFDGNVYTLFSNVSDENAFCFRKTITKDNKKYYCRLADKNEYQKVALKFFEKINR